MRASPSSSVASSLSRLAAGLVSAALLVVTLWGCDARGDAQDGSDSAAAAGAGATPAAGLPADAGGARPPGVVPFRVPSESEIKDSMVLAAVRRGRAMMVNTRDSLPQFVGNRLRCVSCHMGDGLKPDEMPFVGVYARFPQYRSRSGTIQTIEDRINGCFERSMNGKALPHDHRAMRDMVAYLSFLSFGVPVGASVEGQGVPRLDPLAGDTARGRAVFTARCVTCHGADGQGTTIAPPLWGPESYNIGAGMARVRTAAWFIKKSMPFDNPGSLTSQEAHDVSAYINAQPRPDFAKKIEDWPYGDPPADVAYPTRAGRRGAN